MRKRELRGPPAAGHECPEGGEERLEVDVPDPGDVASVGDLVVEGDDERLRRAAVDERANRFVCARGILDQEQEDSLVPDGDAFEPAERRREAPEPGGDLVELRAERAGERRGRDRVVDVVEARQRKLDGPGSLGRVEPE